MRFASLGSGSKGNSTIIEAGSTVVLVDCGFGIRSLTTRLLA
ncbi:MAG: phosphoribosyl 1,2-cyclic phosphodiesterase, partial [Porticoccaceae bacterium]